MGNIAWVKASCTGSQVLLAGNEIILYGSAEGLGGGYSWPSISKFTATGDLIWRHDLQYANPDAWIQYNNLDTTADGNFILSLNYSHIMSGWREARFLKMDTAGNILWQRYLDWMQIEIRLLSAPNNQFVIVGDEGTFIVTDSLGIPLTNVFDTSRYSYFNNVCKSIDHRLLILTRDLDYFSGRSIVYVTDSIGNTECNQIAGPLISVDTTFTLFNQNLNYNTSPATLTITSFPPICNRGVYVSTECLSTVGLNSTSENENLLLFPNPTSGIVTIDIGNFLNSEYTIGIFNALGMKISNVKNSVRKEVQIDLSHLPSGIYFLQAICGEKIWWGKVLKQ